MQKTKMNTKNSIYKNIVISEPIKINGIEYYEHMKFYRRKRDGKTCMYVDHGDGSGYLDDKVEFWGGIKEERQMERADMRAIMGWT